MAPTPERTLTPPDLVRLQHSSSKPSADDAALGGDSSKMSGATIRHSVSMLQMNEIEDMKSFMNNSDTDRSLGDECHGGLLGGKSSAAQDEEDDFLFFDAEDDDDVDDNLYKLVAAAAKSSSTADTKTSSSGGSGGMRRVQSMGAMAQGSQKLSLLSMAPDIHTIHEHEDSSEEGDGNNDMSNREEEQMVQVNFGDDDVKPQPPPESNMKRRLSFNSLRGGLRNSLNSSTHGDDLRSSLKSSTHGDGLRTSLNCSSHSSTGLSSSQHSQPKKSCMKKSTSKSSLKRSSSNVSFGELEIRSYNMTVGDAPTPNGVPLSLDWEHDPEATVAVDVDTYEKNRGTRRNKQEMFVPNQYRVYLLMRDAGLSRREIKLAIDKSQRDFKNRQKTVKNLKMQPVEEAMEKTKRSFSKITRKLSS
eukprot:scaffold9773_cov131-Skeletonema_dohrnii-CCMP3373.AAC.2